MIATLYDENRINVPLDQISRKMVKAIVAIEDYRFYEHGALDLKGTLRALITNQANSGVVQGGSSITQQMVKMTLLSQAKTQGGAEGRHRRHLRAQDRASCATRSPSSSSYSKDWILERYLNIAYFGDGAYGIQAAAQHYFNVNAKDLNLRAVGAAGRPGEEPHRLRPDQLPRPGPRAPRHRARPDGRAQRDHRSDKAEQAEEAAASASTSSTTPQRLRELAGAVLLRLRRSATCSHDQTLGETVAGAQEAAQVRRPDHPHHDRPALSRTPPTTSVRRPRLPDRPGDRRPGDGRARHRRRARRSPSRGRWAATRSKGETYLNYVVPKRVRRLQRLPGRLDVQGVRARGGDRARASRSTPRSTSPPQMLDPDVASTRPAAATTSTAPTSGSPQNSTDSGTFNLYTGTRESVNTFYAQLEQQTGLCEPYRLAKRDGRRPRPTPTASGSRRSPSASPTTSPLEMAEAYATFAARGLHCDAAPVTAIEDADGNVAQGLPRAVQPGDAAAVADAVNDILRGVQEPGGFGYDAGLALNQPSAGKTGTTRRQHGRLVRRLHPEPGHRRDDRRRQRRRAPGSP